ncbi:inner membrane protein YjeH [Clostridium ragsdalei P11]|uniref:Inner membrane protein YjeH n=1 Tax=Clostridium ragsdalei P11 TaxID=1353534 RepID=A0A1A6AHY2_9CLOT|nr:APC family permease [Clostridium ragsdalei]OBR89674.1 inner membrane protein YjeH [Clostridium ragsdalei P11]
MNKSKNIGTITLCGLIVGPVLGSGIVLLPPLAYKLIGKWAIPAWIIIMLLGIIFAYVFVFLSLKSPGNEGVAIAIGNVFGNFFRELTSNFLTAAVCFGPTAVLITAANFLKSFSIFSNIKVEMIAFGMEIICALILICGVKTLAKFTLILTGLTAALLFCGSIYTLIFASNVHAPETSFSFSKFGYTLLLLFWAIIGWEIIGNYIEDIKNPKMTLIKAMTISLIVIISLYITVALSVQNVSSSNHDILAIMTPLFGSFSLPIIAVAASGLCMCTYLMIVGGVSRMSAKRAANNKLPFYLSYINKNGSPINAIITLVCIHLVVLSLAAANFLSLDKIVTCANVFFLSNAIVCLAAGFKLLHNIKLKIAVSILIVSFTLLLFKAALWSISLLIIVILLSLYSNKRLNKEKVPSSCG